MLIGNLLKLILKLQAIIRIFVNTTYILSLQTSVKTNIYFTTVQTQQ